MDSVRLGKMAMWTGLALTIMAACSGGDAQNGGGDAGAAGRAGRDARGSSGATLDATDRGGSAGEARDGTAGGPNVVPEGGLADSGAGHQELADASGGARADRGGREDDAAAECPGSAGCPCTLADCGHPRCQAACSARSCYAVDWGSEEDVGAAECKAGDYMVGQVATKLDAPKGEVFGQIKCCTAPTALATRSCGPDSYGPADIVGPAACGEGRYATGHESTGIDPEEDSNAGLLHCCGQEPELGGNTCRWLTWALNKWAECAAGEYIAGMEGSGIAQPSAVLGRIQCCKAD